MMTQIKKITALMKKIYNYLNMIIKMNNKVNFHLKYHFYKINKKMTLI